MAIHTETPLRILEDKDAIARLHATFFLYFNRNGISDQNIISQNPAAPTEVLNLGLKDYILKMANHAETQLRILEDKNAMCRLLASLFLYFDKSDTSDQNIESQKQAAPTEVLRLVSNYYNSNIATHTETPLRILEDKDAM